MPSGPSTSSSSNATASRAHGTREAFERDRARDRALQVAGWRVIRLTWRQLKEEPDNIAEQLATLLAETT